VQILYLWFLNRYDPLVFVLYIDEFSIVGSLELLMLWCENNLAHEVDMKDVGGWQVVDEVIFE
jgi:hypothetical protein